MPKQSEVQIIHRPDFAKLPSWAKVELNQLTKRLSSLRASVAAESPVKWMPPVDVVPAVWFVPHGGSVDGRMAWRHGPSGSTPCAQFPAQCCAYPDSILRSFLVHEFCHGFRFLELTVDAIDAGRESLDLRRREDESPEEHEEAMHARPDDWFGAPDAENFVRWNDLSADVEQFFVPFFRRWTAAGLPEATAVQPEWAVHTLVFPQHVMHHARQVRTARS